MLDGITDQVDEVEVDRQSCMNLFRSISGPRDVVVRIAGERPPGGPSGEQAVSQASRQAAGERAARLSTTHSGSKSGVSWDPSIFVIGWAGVMPSHPAVSSSLPTLAASAADVLRRASVALSTASEKHLSDIW